MLSAGCAARGLVVDDGGTLRGASSRDPGPPALTLLVPTYRSRVPSRPAIRPPPRDRRRSFAAPPPCEPESHRTDWRRFRWRTTEPGRYSRRAPRPVGTNQLVPALANRPPQGDLGIGALGHDFAPCRRTTMACNPVYYISCGRPPRVGKGMGCQSTNRSAAMGLLTPNHLTPSSPSDRT